MNSARRHRDSDASSVHSTTSSHHIAPPPRDVNAVSVDQLREAYERFRKLEEDERNFTKQLREIKGAKNVLKENFVRYMQATDNSKIQIRGSADALELVEVKKNETLTKEILRQRTIDFFARVGTTPEYRSADAREQCELIIQEVFNRKEFQMVKKLRHTIDRKREKLKHDIERSIPPASSAAPQHARRIIRQVHNP